MNKADLDAPVTTDFEIEDDDLPEYEVIISRVERYIVTGATPEMAVQRVLNTDRPPDEVDLTITVADAS